MNRQAEVRAAETAVGEKRLGGRHPVSRPRRQGSPERGARVSWKAEQLWAGASRPSRPRSRRRGPMLERPPAAQPPMTPMAGRWRGSEAWPAPSRGRARPTLPAAPRSGRASSRCVRSAGRVSRAAPLPPAGGAARRRRPVSRPSSRRSRPPTCQAARRRPRAQRRDSLRAAHGGARPARPAPGSASPIARQPRRSSGHQTSASSAASRRADSSTAARLAASRSRISPWMRSRRSDIARHVRPNLSSARYAKATARDQRATHPGQRGRRGAEQCSDPRAQELRAFGRADRRSRRTDAHDAVEQRLEPGRRTPAVG